MNISLLHLFQVVDQPREEKVKVIVLTMKHLIWESNFMDFIVGNMQKSTHAFALFYQRDNQNHEMVRYAQG